MELWIRSQDKKKLVNTSKLEIRCSYDKYMIIGDLTTLATYQTIERALEVLDEIQNILKPIIINKQIKSDGMLADGLSDGVLHTYDVNEIQELSTYVYEMPEE